ncbi:multidrug DMT transporter permease [Paracoccus suum]|uniref:Multidrug DMT transporter permease n=1 Tax=Paracoccus suum TaxID=2259340 RepID=A0A344PMR8_9RHOB|nr:iron uptake system protein EfeO [Paracoccus suum]AXC50673.1 multidrug DMT transporter permease [Paracoccus suum]
MTASAPGRMLPLAVGGAALLVVLGAGAFYAATRTASGPERGNVHKVSVGQNTCEPADFTVPAGPTTFEIHNESDRTIEWEILDGVMVVEERENIAPGFHALVTGRLSPGSYQITCGLLSNPRGTLTVTRSEASDVASAAPPMAAFVGPLSEYRVYLAGQASALVAAVTQLDAAIKAGDQAAARTAWIEARAPYKRIEAVAGRMADLENSIDPLPEYLAKREADPDFTGFHRIEYGLWAEGQGGTEGLAPVSARLLADVTTLKDRLRELKLAPAELAGTAARQAGHLSAGQITAGEDRWSGGDLQDIAAGLDGIAKSAGLMRVLVAEAAPDVATAYDKALVDAQGSVASLTAQPGHGDLDKAARADLAARFAALDQAIAAMNPAIGLN